MHALIFDIQRNSFVDGPGIRTTVFFKGCNLRCKWCHNPESQKKEKEIMFYKNKCTLCGRCRDVEEFDETFFCYNDARGICGKDYTTDEVLKIIIKDKTFYDNSGGGVTFSGGECMLQIDFLSDILKQCRKEGIHTAVDTAGCVPWEYFEKIIPHTSLFLYDIKSMDSAVHKEYTGVPNELILENLSHLLSLNVPLWIRVPVIPVVNDTEEEMQKVRDFLDKYGYPEKIELLPYHAMGEHKYASLGKSVEKFEVPDKGKIEKLKQIVVPY